MVCGRCIMAVKEVLNKAGIEASHIDLGEVETAGEISTQQLEQLRHQLATLGFELLDDSRKKTIERIKNFVIQHIHHQDGQENYNYSTILSEALHKDYSSLSRLFSEVEGVTIEKYIINQKIERVKELITYDEKSLSEIADQLGYSSVAHVSAQFKKVTGLTPSHFKKIGENKRKPIDKV